MKKVLERLYNGIIKENPTFVLMLGMCPTLAVTTSAKNGLGMGLATMAVLILSNAIISLLRKVIPNGVRVPIYIIIIASFVTIVEMLMHAYVTSLYSNLGIFIPLIVVNCIIFGRAEQYASKNNVLLSIFDGIGIGLGFTLGLTVIGIVRELLGSGTIFGLQVMPKSYEPISIFVMAPGAFFVLSILCAIQNKLKLKGANRHVKGNGACCSGDCANCPSAKEEVENNG
jgi:electron transport complex protein RnfE